MPSDPSRIALISCPIDFCGEERGTYDAYEDLDLTHQLPHAAVTHIDARIQPSDTIHGRMEEVCRNLGNAVAGAIEHNMIPLTIGGDHSLVYGSLQGVTKKIDPADIGVIYIDAHGDFNTTETSPSDHIHGMSLAMACNIRTDGTTTPRPILPKNICMIGTRDLDPGERELIKSHDIYVATPETIDSMGIDSVMDQVLHERLNDCRHLHVSFDIDALNPVFAPATGLHVPFGLYPREMHRIMTLLHADGRVGSADIVEYCPRRDEDNRTHNIVVTLLQRLFGISFI